MLLLRGAGGALGPRLLETEMRHPIHVAAFEPGDRDAVIDLILAIQRGEFGVPITLADQPDLADVPGFYQTDRGGFWVAREGEAIVGTIGLLDGGVAALRKMFVRKDRRGREQRIAERLLEVLVAHARERRIPSLMLGTRPEMLAAHRFYEKNGFVRVEAAALPAGFARMAVDSVFYRREL